MAYLIAARTWTEVLVGEVQLLDAQGTDLLLLFIVDELVLRR
jgi:hypothetical protein